MRRAAANRREVKKSDQFCVVGEWNPRRADRLKLRQQLQRLEIEELHAPIVQGNHAFAAQPGEARLSARSGPGLLVV